MPYFSSTPAERARSGVAAGAVVGAIGWALLNGLGVGAAPHGAERDAVFALAPVPPEREKRVIPPKVRSRRPEGRAAPPNLRATPTEVVAPAPVVVLPVPPIVIAAPVAGVGAAPSAGAADRPGPGTGAGGEGDGLGGGGSGDGDGGGGRPETPPKRIKGRITARDYPDAAEAAGAQGVVETRFTVETDGRATGCVVTRSSGNAELDRTTCALVEERFRYRPWLDGDRRPVRSVVRFEQEWTLERVAGE